MRLYLRFFNLVTTETITLFKHPYFEFLAELDVFAPAESGVPNDRFCARDG